MAALRGLSDQEVSTILDELRTSPIGPRHQVEAAVAARLSNHPPALIHKILTAIYALYDVRGLAEAPVDEFVDDLVAAMRETGSAELAVEERESVVRRLHAVLAVDPLAVRAKAHALQRDHEHIFHDAKILTDLRPVFSTPDAEPEGVIIEYTLKIVFHDGARHKEVYMALDASDLSRLREIIQRAEMKVASLSAMLDAKNITHLRIV